jgi:HEPN domain-containing protein
MRTARSIAAQLQQASEYLPEPGPALRRYDQVRHWVVYAKAYLSASVRLRDLDPPLLHPWAQVTGHAVECSVKSFLYASGRDVPYEHNLVTLLDWALEAGLSVEERDIFLLVDINHLYFKDLRSNTLYKARYPAKHSEMFGGTIPDSQFLERIVGSFCDQAAALNEKLNRNAEIRK